MTNNNWGVTIIAADGKRQSTYDLLRDSPATNLDYFETEPTLSYLEEKSNCPLRYICQWEYERGGGEKVYASTSDCHDTQKNREWGIIVEMYDLISDTEIPEFLCGTLIRVEWWPDVSTYNELTYIPPEIIRGLGGYDRVAALPELKDLHVIRRKNANVGGGTGYIDYILPEDVSKEYPICTGTDNMNRRFISLNLVHVPSNQRGVLTFFQRYSPELRGESKGPCDIWVSGGFHPRSHIWDDLIDKPARVNPSERPVALTNLEAIEQFLERVLSGDELEVKLLF